jgi:hypothetical protein
MHTPRRFGVSGRFGLALLVAWPALVVGLAIHGGSPVSIALIALLGMPLALLGAITWLKAGQRHADIYFQKRLMTGIFTVFVACGLLSALLR